MRLYKLKNAVEPNYRETMFFPAARFQHPAWRSTAEQCLCSNIFLAVLKNVVPLLL